MNHTRRILLLLAVLLGSAGGCVTIRPVRELAGGPALEAAFSPDGKLLAAATADAIVHVWSTSSGEELARCDGYALTYGSFCTRRIAFSPDGSRVAFAAIDGSVRVWHWREERIVAVLAGHPHAPSFVQFTADGRVVSASGGFAYDRVPRPTSATMPTTRRGFEPSPIARREPLTVIAWDVNRAEEVSRWQDDAAGVLYAAIAPDGRTVSTIGVPGMPRSFADMSRTTNYQREIAVWDVQSGAAVRRWADTDTYMPTYLAMSHDGRWLLSSGMAGITSAPGALRDIATGTTRPVRIRGADFAPDDRRLRGVVDVTKNGGFSFLAPPPKPKIRVIQADVQSGQVLTSRDIRTNPRTWVMAWTEGFTMFVDRELRLWKVPE